MCLLIWTVFSGEWCGPWASCFKKLFKIAVLEVVRIVHNKPQLVVWNHKLCENLTAVFSIFINRKVLSLFTTLKRLALPCCSVLGRFCMWQRYTSSQKSPPQRLSTTIPTEVWSSTNTRASGARIWWPSSSGQFSRSFSP